MKEKKNLTKISVESSLMVAFATVLSLLKLIEMPYGGSVTPASMLPILIVSYRHGIPAGLASGLVYSVIQQLLGLNNLSYFTTWQSVVAVMLLDYIAAFALAGLGGLFKGKMGLGSLSQPKRQSVELATGMAFICVLRYICHTVSGATVWAGLSIPSGAALVYSLGYNATYMIPETVVGVSVSVWIGSVIDFSRKTPSRFLPSESASVSRGGSAALLPSLAALAALVALIADTLLIAAHTQDPESGEFTFAYLSEVSWLAVGIVSAAGVIAVALLLVLPRILAGREN